MNRFALMCFAGTFALATANAQEFSKFSFDFGGGYTVPAGSTGNYLNTGWGLRAGFGMNFSSTLGAMINLGYDSMGIDSGTLGSIGVGGGDVNIFHATLDPVIHIFPHHRASFYLTGGGGVFHRYQEFSNPTVVSTTAYIPFFGFYPVSFGANQIVASYSVTKPGFDVGAGAEFGALGHGKFFTEAKWNHMFLAGGHTDYIPVSFGFRW
ncbi:MAG TPA: hypothetical protein VGL82_20330 [Bryobacteraceae bacterium]|jgi:hypothetical protein